jgi:phosphoserine phosphatase RsbU/P
MLNTFLKAVRKLNAFGVLDEVLHILLEAALRRTHAHRVFVFVRHDGGALRLLAGRDTNGQEIEEGSTVSRDAASGATEFLGNIADDTGKLREVMPRYSPDRFLCLPLCQIAFDDEGEGDGGKPERSYVQGVVCFDYPSSMPSSVSYGIIKEMAESAATLVENAALVKAEIEARYVRKELAIAADIQQRLMRVIVPDVAYAKVKAVSFACKDIGGDFFDLVHTSSGLSLIVADVSGKGVAAAVVAGILQGMLYSHLARNSPLPEMIEAVNRFLCDKVSGQKFATLVVARLAPNGEMELINCGHVPPIIISGKMARAPEGRQLSCGTHSPGGVTQPACS